PKVRPEKIYCNKNCYRVGSEGQTRKNLLQQELLQGRLRRSDPEKSIATRIATGSASKVRPGKNIIKLLNTGLTFGADL
ncbi:MAG TPA: hypothetical protein PKU77_01175, partial [Ferruginibacter sp.]|nr:hypothetical protein [Ferruginibacter sp.]